MYVYNSEKSTMQNSAHYSYKKTRVYNHDKQDCTTLKYNSVNSKKTIVYNSVGVLP